MLCLFLYSLQEIERVSVILLWKGEEKEDCKGQKRQTRGVKRVCIEMTPAEGEEEGRDGELL